VFHIKIKTMRILCIAVPSKKGDNKVHKIDKDLEELKTLSSKHPLSWIVKGIETKRTPNSEKLSPCSFHSYLDSNVEKDNVEVCFKYASECLNTRYAIYDENYICYDLCEHQAEIINNKQMKINEHYHNVFQNLEGYYIKKMSNFIYFDKILSERNALILERSKLDEPSSIDFPINKEIERLLEESVLGKFEYKLVYKNTERVYKNTKSIWEKVSLDNYLLQETFSIKNKLENNKKDIEIYLNENNHLRSEISKYKYKIIDNLVNNRTNRLKQNYKVSYTNILLLRRELTEILHYCKINVEYRDYIENIEELIKCCDENLRKFSEFKEHSDDNVLLAVVDYEEDIKARKLQELEKEEKLHKEKITKVAISSNSVIVRADGTVVQDDSSGPKMVVGKVIESKADLDAEKQARIDRNTTWL
jgi:hypothetical protein